MIQPQLFRDQGIVEIRPSGPLARADFEELALLVDPFIETHGDLRGLAIVAERFPGWDSFAALLEHLRFVRGHHQKVRRVAVVSDAVTLTLLPRLASHFVSAEVRHFPYGERNEALAWLEGRT